MWSQKVIKPVDSYLINIHQFILSFMFRSKPLTTLDTCSNAHSVLHHLFTPRGFNFVFSQLRPIRIALTMRPHHGTKLRSTPRAAVTSVSRTSNRLNLVDVRLRSLNKVRHSEDKVTSMKNYSAFFF